MEFSNEHQRRLAMLKAALPYVPPQNKKAMEIILQADNLISLATEVSTNDDDMTLRAAQTDTPATPAVYEKLLLNIKDYCTPAESEIVRMLLNFLHADELFKNYRDFTKSHASIHTDEYGENDNQNFMMEFLMSQLSPKQRTTFEQVATIMNNKKGDDKAYE
ncbi:hypothetical protein KQI69_05800 [Eubacterium sp. MSJ-13]|uniref:hypothetical protein n=1 Tax=Eubacterium sp. MSJ-13 TaxID=2841513 RepID=UPI001C118CA6|nr:hypothetical protein [Eubacterium sp. MSJ-13]MBU5478714.1 hypothetical protein [Eubacterium sp. MSJ-13]